MNTGSDRIATLDILRGVAVMGIFAMNIIAFSMPRQAGANPLAYGLDGTGDYWAWSTAFIVFDGKMRGLFSFLFGASMLLVIARANAAGLSGASIHFRRMAWLLVFGLLHFTLVWYGDILTLYAIIGAIAYLFHDGSPRKLLTLSIVFWAIQLIFMAGLSAAFLFAESAGTAPGASPGAIESWRGMAAGFERPSAAALSSDFALHRGPWLALVQDRLGDVAGDVSGQLFSGGFETLAFMLAGMWGYRSGFLTGTWSRRTYVWVAVIALTIGVTAYAFMAGVLYGAEFRASYMFAVAIGATTLFRPIMVIGYAALIILVTHNGGALVARIAAAGRAAFTNYLGASLIATVIFYGFGAGLYGRMTRWEVYPLVLAVWMAILLWSKPWLDTYRYGPFEWLWRSLSRGERQPLRA